MKSCRKCGFSNNDSMRFCVECGTVLKENPKMVVPLGPPGAGERPTDSFENETVMADRGGGRVPVVSEKGGGKRALRILIGVIVAGVLLVTFAAAGVILAVYLAIINEQPRPLVKKPETTRRPTVSKTPRKKSVPTPGNTPVNQTPGKRPTDELAPTGKAVFSVKADHDWQVSEIRTVGNENFRIVASGRYELGGIRRGVTARGVPGHMERRLFREFRTGALLMRTHLPDGSHSNIQAVASGRDWQNYPDENGYLEFTINDNSPGDNEGNLTIQFEMVDTAEN